MAIHDGDRLRVAIDWTRGRMTGTQEVGGRTVQISENLNPKIQQAAKIRELMRIMALIRENSPSEPRSVSGVGEIG